MDGTTEELRVPAGPQLEADVLAALAREGDCRHLFGVLTSDDFYAYRHIFEGLAAVHAAGELCCQADDVGTGYHWRGLRVSTVRTLNRLCAQARTLGSRVAGAAHLHRIALERDEMEATGDLFNALGAGDADAAEDARARLLEIERERMGQVAA